MNTEKVIQNYKKYDLLINYTNDGVSMTEDTCKFIGQFIREIKPRNILEFGSGLSTYIFAHKKIQKHQFLQNIEIYCHIDFLFFL